MSTVLSVLTPAGRGAVAVVAVAGTDAVKIVDEFFRAKNRKPLAEQQIRRIVYGDWLSTGEDIVLCRRGEDSLEIHCHGGTQSVASITGDLVSRGCRVTTWQEWLASRTEDVLQAEAEIALASTASLRTAEILLDQFHGALRRELVAILELVKQDTNVVEARLSKLAETTELGRHLTEPWQVVIAGRPNVGKSSLINALVGYERAIVFDQPGTTRDVVTAATLVDGWPVTLSDTAGLHDATESLESAGIELARARLSNADLVVWVIDASRLDGERWQDIVLGDERELNLALPKGRLTVLNKIDCAREPLQLDGAVGTSAITGEGIDELLDAISKALVPRPLEPSAAVLFSERQVSAVEAAQDACGEGRLDDCEQLIAKLMQTDSDKI